jgi:hypothetical protein
MPQYPDIPVPQVSIADPQFKFDKIAPRLNEIADGLAIRSSTTFSNDDRAAQMLLSMSSISTQYSKW